MSSDDSMNPINGFKWLVRSLVGAGDSGEEPDEKPSESDSNESDRGLDYGSENDSHSSDRLSEGTPGPYD